MKVHPCHSSNRRALAYATVAAVLGLMLSAPGLAATPKDPKKAQTVAKPRKSSGNTSAAKSSAAATAAGKAAVAPVGPVPPAAKTLAAQSPAASSANTAVSPPAGTSPRATGTANTQVAATPTAREEDLPLSKDDLFGLDKPEPGEVKPGSPKAAAAPEKADESSGFRLKGFWQTEAAYRYHEPGQWSRLVNRLQVGTEGAFSATTRWKVNLRMDVDPLYFATDRYPDPVKEDQRLNLLIRETYLDTAAGGWDFRLGRQNIIWGEVVGLFFADVVSARDMRDFVLPQFDVLRIPQWAIRAERFGKRFNTELIWIPFPSYDNIGKPGSEFYPFPAEATLPGASLAFTDPVRPANKLANSNGGVRVSTLAGGWDLAGFYYTSLDAQPTFYRDILPTPTPTVQYQPRHDRINQWGGTVTKDFGFGVLRAEGVYTTGRNYSVSRLDAPNGVVQLDTLSYILSADFIPMRDMRLNLQYFTTHFFDYDPTMLVLVDRNEAGVSGLLAYEMARGFEPQILVIQSLERNESLIRPRLTWKPEKNWRLALGADIFTGPARGYFGRYDNRDRVYVEARYTF